MKRVFALVDERIERECELSLIRLGFKVVKLPAHPSLEKAVCSHTDLLIHYLGGELICTAEYCEENEALFTLLNKEIRELKFGFCSDIISSPHPRDAALNALVAGGRIYAREDAISPYLKKKAEDMGIAFVAVKQGYPACTVLKLNENAVITADTGMERALTNHGVRVYKIAEGGINLYPYPYGFIGGAAGVYNNTVYFLGDPSFHPSYEIIKEAAEREGLTVVALSGSRLCDLGGIVFIEDNVQDGDN